MRSKLWGMISALIVTVGLCQPVEAQLWSGVSDVNKSCHTITNATWQFNIIGGAKISTIGTVAAGHNITMQVTLTAWPWAQCLSGSLSSNTCSKTSNTPSPTSATATGSSVFPLSSSGFFNIPMTGLQDGNLIYSQTEQVECVVPSVCISNPAYCGGSPILIPLHAMQVADDPTATNNGNTIKLTDAAHGVVFDIFNNGSPVQVAWQADNNSAFLAIDRNGDGMITNAGELFGNHTVPGSDNGFHAIAMLMMGPQKSGVYQIGDPGFDRLLLWTDRNHDGVGTPDELRPAQEVISAITTGAIAVGKRDRYGNLFASQGRVQYLGGAPDDWRPVYDVMLQTQ